MSQLTSKKKRLSFANSGSMANNVNLEMNAPLLTVRINLPRRRMSLPSINRRCATPTLMATANMADAASSFIHQEISLISTTREQATKIYLMRTLRLWSKESTQSLTPTSIPSALPCHPRDAFPSLKASAPWSKNVIKRVKNRTMDRRRILSSRLRKSTSSPRKFNLRHVSASVMEKKLPPFHRSLANECM